MASPVKAFIDPTGLDRFPRDIVCISPMPGRSDFQFGRLFGSDMRLDGPQVLRFSVVTLFGQAVVGKSVPAAPVNPMSLPNTNYKIATFSPIYQERGASASRGTEGQLYPTPF